MKTCQILIALIPVILVYQVRSEDFVEIKAHSSQLFVPFGEFVWVNCSTSDPKETEYESRLKKNITTKGPNWIATQVIVDDWENSTLHCLYIGDKTAVPSVQSPTTVLAYAVPSNVTVDLETAVEEGKEYTINCTVQDVAPLEYLTINVFRGEDVIDHKSYNGPHVVGKKTESHVYKYTASRQDHNKNFTCEAVLQLGAETKSVRSPEITVQTYTLPESPDIRVQEWIERGTVTTAECLIANAFPPEEVKVKMFVEETQVVVDTAQTNEGNVKSSAELNTTDLSLGSKTIRCESDLFTLTKDATAKVNIYDHPTLAFNLSSNIVDLDEEVTASCNVTNEHPQAYVMRIIMDHREEMTAEDSTIIHTITANQRTPRISVTCTAFIANSSISQSSTQTLEVHYPPEFSETLCPSSVLLVEGGRPFSCQADGNPQATVRCYNGNHIIRNSETLTRDMSGLYTCQAANDKGEKEKAVSITVQYAPSSPTVTVSTNATIQTGYPLNITCQSDGLPAPTYSWQIPNNAKVVYSPDRSSIIIHTAASTHNGTYTCLAKNAHGEMSSKQEVTIVPVELPIVWIVIGVIAFIALAIFIGIVGYIYWKKGRKGFYALLTSHNNRKPAQHNIPTESPNNKTTGV
ncbi:intercellular adhesion molecule 5-like [Anomaloglossus baeobatrachus]|uniref:intercellular adhesion molecule 5-like isoform X1 n=1 Tax=Anomaloglossus baeobatrachus TaxID=238106 RepID=UPI003F507458